MKHPHKKLTLAHALHVKAAEWWVIMGDPLQALAELKKIPGSAAKNEWASSVYKCAVKALAFNEAKNYGV